MWKIEKNYVIFYIFIDVNVLHLTSYHMKCFLQQSFPSKLSKHISKGTLRTFFFIKSELICWKISLRKYHTFTLINLFLFVFYLAIYNLYQEIKGSIYKYVFSQKYVLFNKVMVNHVIWAVCLK